MTRREINRARAVNKALARLGMQANAQEVIAFLAGYGVQVDAGLVQQVRRNLLKEAPGTRRRQVAVPNTRERLEARLPLEMAQQMPFHQGGLESVNHVLQDVFGFLFAHQANEGG